MLNIINLIISLNSRFSGGVDAVFDATDWNRKISVLVTAIRQILIQRYFLQTSFMKVFSTAQLLHSGWKIVMEH